MKTLFIFLVLTFFFTNAQAQEIEAKLSGDSQAEGFSVKDSAGTTLFRIDGAGRVGIGTTSQLLKSLEISDTQMQIQFTDSDHNVTGLLSALGGGGGLVDLRSVTNHSLTFATNSTERMRILASGNVGLGTTNPSATLDIVGTTELNGDVDINSDLNVDGATLHVDATSNRIGIGTTSPGKLLDINGSLMEILFTDSDNSVSGMLSAFGSGSVDLRSVTNHRLTFATNSIERMRITESGNVGIGTANAIWTLTVGGDIGGTGGLYHASDIRWKKNIQSLTNSLEKITMLRGVNYVWRVDEFAEMNFPEGKQIGLIAQEVEEVIPELVNTSDDGYKSVDYAKLVSVLVEAVKEQQKQIEALESKINSIALKEIDRESYGYIKTNINK